MKEYAVGGVSIMFVILGLVQWTKDTFGLSGRAVKALSMGLGVLFGITYQVTTMPEIPIGQWFFVVLFGLMLGLSASGSYDVIAKARPATTINTNNVSLPYMDESSPPSQE